MYVDHALRRHLQESGFEDVPIPHHDTEVRPKFSQLIEEFGIIGTRRLENGKLLFKGFDFYRRRYEVRVVTALGFVRLGDYCRYVKALFNQSSQRGDCKLGSPEKNQPHTQAPGPTGVRCFR